MQCSGRRSVLLKVFGLFFLERMCGQIEPLVLNLYQNVYVAILEQTRNADYETDPDRMRVGENLFSL